MQIYGFATFNALKVVMTALELNLDFNYNQLNFQRGEHKAPEHMERHPLGKVPAVEIDGKSYIESNSICRHLALKERKLYGANIEEQTRVNESIDLIAFHMGRHLQVFFWEEKIKAKFGKKPDQAKVAEARSWLDKQCPILDKRLLQQSYMAGNFPSIADTIAYCYFAITLDTSYDLEGYKALNKWFQNIHSKEATQKARDIVYGNTL